MSGAPLKGWPAYVDDDVRVKVEQIAARAEYSVLSLLIEEFGRVAVRGFDRAELRGIVSALVVDVAHEVGGAVSVERALDAQQASFNVLQATLAGIELASRKSGES